MFSVFLQPAIERLLSAARFAGMFVGLGLDFHYGDVIFEMFDYDGSGGGGGSRSE